MLWSSCLLSLHIRDAMCQPHCRSLASRQCNPDCHTPSQPACPTPQRGAMLWLSCLLHLHMRALHMRHGVGFLPTDPAYKAVY